MEYFPVGASHVKEITTNSVLTDPFLTQVPPLSDSSSPRTPLLHGRWDRVRTEQSSLLLFLGLSEGARFGVSVDLGSSDAQFGQA